jgi:hypothetical protein
VAAKLKAVEDELRAIKEKEEAEEAEEAKVAEAA